MSNTNNLPLPLFSLRARTIDGQPIFIKAEDAGKEFRSHARVNIEVKVGGEVLFPMGQLYVGVNFMHATNGNFAKNLVCECLALKPGDTDADFFADYTPKQLAFVKAHSDLFTMKAEAYK